MPKVYRLPKKNGYGRTVGYYEYTPLERLRFLRKAIREALGENNNTEYLNGLIEDYLAVLNDCMEEM